MSLIRDDYRAEVLGGLADAGEELLHVFLEADAGVLRERLNVRAPIPDNPDSPEARGSACATWTRPSLPLPAGREGRSCCARTGLPRPSWPTK